ncbi:hypothetical protein SCH01S_17_00160 [Sphingomonas changbaiensis NBRC 104936]|uniref:PEP-CTERM protein-sorting domain-containing protein n=1 Tax=Sphingomonas changbaiensis NBRC 104936 TaxID=1219043 RepID=A0A0E9MLJ0_9SPHN|nr:hypothetical protein [Sphingomonas changbaiensis]GAO38662.1 hypothetical protein SCH01S_17_00160 [Sphingomonas changbaiensis NBRC 104936]
MKRLVLTLVAATCLAGTADAATIYANRAAFEATLASKLVDTFETAQGYPAAFSVLSDAAMSAVVGQTKYTTTGFANNNIIFGNASNQLYCAGCNGSFRVTFDSTSYGTSAGVFGAGVDVEGNDAGAPYFAFITYGDNSTDNIPLAPTPFGTPYFFGVTSSLGVKSIDFGFSGGATAQSGSFSIDNLTIGSTTAVPEAPIWAALILGFGLAGAALRQARGARVVHAMA